MTIYSEIFPSPEIVMSMEPEELGPLVLSFLSQTRSGHLHLGNFLLQGQNAEFKTWAESINIDLLLQKFSVAWRWLEKELFIAPKPGGIEWIFITDRGYKLLELEDYNSFKLGYLLPEEGLDPNLNRIVRIDFMKGDYDIAIFKAFKELEVRVRDKANLGDDEIGVKLMRKAFKPDGGILTDDEMHSGEKLALMELFTGSIGTYKNPASHRYTHYSNPSEAAGIIQIANTLLRIVESL